MLLGCLLATLFGTQLIDATTLQAAIQFFGGDPSSGANCIDQFGFPVQYFYYEDGCSFFDRQVIINGVNYNGVDFNCAENMITFFPNYTVSGTMEVCFSDGSAPPVQVSTGACFNQVGGNPLQAYILICCTNVDPWMMPGSLICPRVGPPPK